MIDNRLIEESYINPAQDINFQPVLTKENYFTLPDFDVLMKMSLNELEKVENFSIFNEYGKIEFQGFTDLTYVNLDISINIDFKLITVYQNCDIPEVGQKLNKPAILHFFQFFVEEEILQNDKDFSNYVQLLEENVKKSNVCKYINLGEYSGPGHR